MFCNNTCTSNVRQKLPQEQLSNSNTGCYVGCATLGGISVQEWFGGGWWASGKEGGKKRQLFGVSLFLMMLEHCIS